MRQVCTKDLDRPIRIQRNVTSPDGKGGRISNWVDAFSCFAQITTLFGTETNNSNRVQATKMIRVTIRFRDGIDEAMRILYQDRTMNIRFLNDLGERHQWLEMQCQENVAL